MNSKTGFLYINHAVFQKRMKVSDNDDKILLFTFQARNAKCFKIEETSNEKTRSIQHESSMHNNI